MSETPQNGKKNWTESFRFLTPVILFILSTMGGMIKYGIDINNQKLTSIDEKLFKHLTNDDIHTPKIIAVTRPEFLIYQEMRSKEMESLRLLILNNSNDTRDNFKRIETLIITHIQDKKQQYEMP